MAIEGLEHFSKDELIAEFINRETVVGIVIFSRGDAKAGRVEPGELVITKSPPLTQQGVESLLQWGLSQVPGMFDASSLPLSAELPPLRLDDTKTLRVGKSRITLDLLVEEFENGQSPEEMVRAYDSLELADVYATLGYYLRHREQVRQYLARRAAEADELQARTEAEHPPLTRAELLARRNPGVEDHASTGN